MLCVVIFTNNAISKYVKNEQKNRELLILSIYQKIIKVFIINNLELLQKANATYNYSIPQQIIMFKEYMKNQIFIPESSLNVKQYNNQLGYLNLQELLNELSDQMFDYNITINGQSISSHGIINDHIALSEKYKITNNLLCTTSIQINEHSTYAQDIAKQLNQHIIDVAIISGIIFLYILPVLYYLIKKRQKINIKMKQLSSNLDKATERSNNIILFQEVNKAFILKCYQYSKNVFNKNLHKHSMTEPIDIQKKNYTDEYLPLILTGEQQFNFHELLLEPIVNELQDYFNGYVAYYNTKITLEINNALKSIKVPFDNEVFTQIIVSLFCNVLYFNKNLDKLKYITLSFNSNVITYSSDGFLLDQNLAIRYSEKIFNDTGNLYLLNLGQIFALLKKQQLNYVVEVRDKATTIEIQLHSSVAQQNDLLRNDNIIVLDFMKKKKK